MALKAETQQKKKPWEWFKINTRLLPVKGFYFTFLAGIGSLMKFMSIYMKQLGLSSLESGIIYGIMPFVGTFVRPLFGILADKTRRFKEILMACSFLTGIFFLLLLWVPSNQNYKPFNVTTSISCNVQDSYIHDCEDSKTDDFCRQSFLGIAKISNGSFFSCSMACTLADPLANTNHNGTQACFVSDFSLPQNLSACPRVSDGDVVHLKLKNASAVASQEVVRDRQNVGTLHCRNFDLKDVTYNEVSYWQMLCTQEATFSCQLNCQQVQMDRCHIFFSEFGKPFGMFFIFYLIGNIFFAPTFSLADSIAYDSLQGKHSKWGHQRLWGTIGFAVFGVTSTFIMDQISRSTDDINYEIAFWIFLGFCILAAVDAHFLKISSELHCQYAFTNVCQLFKEADVVVFLIMITYLGCLDGVIEAFLFWFMKELGSTQLTLGVSMVVSCLAEIFFLFFSGKIIKLIGRENCIYAAFTAQSLRFLFYSLLSNPWQVVPVELLHGLTFGLLWAAASSHAAIIAPPGTLATMQGVLGGLYFGFGKGIGSIVTGFMYKPIGGRWTFRIYAISTVILLVFFFLLHKLWLGPRHRALAAQQAAKQEEPGQVEIKLLETAEGENLHQNDSKQEMEIQL